MNNLMSAKEFERKLQEELSAKDEEQLVEIKQKMKDALEEGKRQLYMYESLRPKVRKLLEDKGWDVNYSCWRNEPLTTISLPTNPREGSK